MLKVFVFQEELVARRLVNDLGAKFPEALSN